MEDRRAFLGLDFGTESVRALIVGERGEVRGASVCPFASGQIGPGSPAARSLFSDPLPPGFALQHPRDWIEGMTAAAREASAQATGTDVQGVGVSFTSCTMLPARDDGLPLSLVDTKLASRPHAWPKLWKHHGALAQTELLNAAAIERDESLLARYGGVIGLEWFFPKILEVIEGDPEIADATDVWIEAGDWIVWQLTGAESAGGRHGRNDIVRSTCQAGYKALWSRADGYPVDFLAACDPALGEAAARKVPGSHRAPGEPAGPLCESMATQMSLRPGIPVSTAIIDAHAGVPGAGVADTGVLVMVLGTSACHMLMDPSERLVPGVAGIVEDGILPGAFGYETGQAAVGDAFDWVRRLCGSVEFASLEGPARDLPPGCEGLAVLDWFNGCRTPLMDGGLTGSIWGATLRHGPAHLYRAVMEASACGLRWIVDTLRDGGVAVDRFVATGGLATASPLFTELLAATLGSQVEVRRESHGSALGAAVLGAVAGCRFRDHRDAVAALAGAGSAVPDNLVVTPPADLCRSYDRVYERYRRMAAQGASSHARDD